MSRITFDPGKRGGRPGVRSLRIADDIAYREHAVKPRIGNTR